MLTKDSDDYVRLALLRALVPDLLHGDEFVAFATAGGGHPLRQGLAEVAHKIPTADLDATIRVLAPILSSATVSASTRNAFEVAAPLLQARLERGGPVDPTVVEGLVAVERLRHDHTSMNLSDAEEKALARLLARNDEVRRDLWRRRFLEASQSAQAFTHIMSPHFGDAQTEDLEWLWGLVPAQSAGNRSDARSCSNGLELAWGGRSFRSSGSNVSPDLVTYFNPVRWERSWRRSAKPITRLNGRRMRRPESRTRRRWRRADIESGGDLDALLWAWNRPRVRGLKTPVRPDWPADCGREYVRVFLAIRAA